MLLKKVWGLVSNRSKSSSSSSDCNQIFSSSSLGAFNQLSADILMQILRKLGTKDAMKMSVVCKSWKSLISDNLLWIFFLQNQAYESWDSIFFAETSLWSGMNCKNLHFVWIPRKLGEKWKFKWWVRKVFQYRSCVSGNIEFSIFLFNGRQYWN